MTDIKAFAKKCFSNSNGSHNWEHTCRVYNLCIHIGQKERADMEVLKIAAYLHDIGRSRQDKSKGTICQDKSKGTICHAVKGAEMAKSFLDEYEIPEDQEKNIIHCIRSHRFRGNLRPETLEAKVLFDADKLDAIGAIGIARAFQFAGEVGAKFHNPDVQPEHTEPYTEEDTGYREFKLKLGKIKDRMLTDEGRHMAQDRHAFMESFFERFLQEHEGYK
ncbi:MAG: HD domain-containing protein [Deltaproteobacteria bacterium]|nr:HD domain-containing protein [Deltaproteobacteria bacterium]